MTARKIAASTGLVIALAPIFVGCGSADATPEKSDSGSHKSAEESASASDSPRMSKEPRVRPEQGDKLPTMKHGSYRETLLDLDENSSTDDGANFYQALVTLEDVTQVNCISTQSGNNRAQGSALSCDWAGAKRPGDDSEKE